MDEKPVIPNNQEQPTEELKIQSEGGLVKSFTEERGKMKPKNLKMALAIFFMVVLGVVSGYGLSLYGSSKSTSQGTTTASGDTVQKGVVIGSPDEETFRDSAEGELKKGGIDGEGSHHLVRPGGESQNVYLTSSILDLDQYTDHKIKVWGETFAAQKAGWLMDVGRLEVVE